jgi:hypothetical protein
MKKLLPFALFAMIGLIVGTPSGAQQTTGGHVAWVGDVLQRMETIKPGMTRKTLLTVFTAEGGLSTGLRRRFVSRDCPYFKVDVEFQSVGRPARDESGRVTGTESDDDIILKLSAPYLQFSVRD